MKVFVMIINKITSKAHCVKLRLVQIHCNNYLNFNYKKVLSLELSYNSK